MGLLVPNSSDYPQIAALDLGDTSIAFVDRSDRELRKKYFLFRLMSSSALTNLFSTLTVLLLKLHVPIEGLIRQTVFKQFCGGETIESCDQVVAALSRHNIAAILDYSVEAQLNEGAFEETTSEIVRSIKRAADDENISIAVFKVTGIARFGLLEKLAANQTLLLDEQAEWQRVRDRVETICASAQETNKTLLIDGEESWIQDAIDNMAMDLMEKYNRHSPLVFNTIQLYRTDRLAFLERCHHQARHGGYLLAVKLVRGAYMEKERERAATSGVQSPIHESKQATDEAYNEALRYCVEHIESIAFFVGSHNQASVELLDSLLRTKNLRPNHPHILCAQLYGMGDNLSYALAKNNYNVSKLIPYGDVRSAVPYLIRRARENTSVWGHMSREAELIRKELRRRGLA